MVTLRSYIVPLEQAGCRTSLAWSKACSATCSATRSSPTWPSSAATRSAAKAPRSGMLFQASNTKILNNDLSQQRQRALDRAKANGATAQTLKIAGREVSFFSTPDNRLRSFHAVDGDFHLVTTSRAMVERFLTRQRRPRLARQVGRVPLCPPGDAADPQRHDLRLFLVRVLRGPAQPAIPGRAGAADEVGHRHGAAAAGPAGRRRRAGPRRHAGRSRLPPACCRAASAAGPTAAAR